MSALWALLIVFVLSIYFSAMETAYTAFDRILTVGWLRAHRFGARAVHFLSSRPERFLSATLIGNNIANVAYSSLLVVLAKAAGIHEVWLLVASPLVVLVFAEVLPKMTGFALANLMVRWFSAPLLVAYYLFLPVRLLLLPLTRLLAREPDEKEAVARGESLRMRKELDQVLVGAEAEGAVTPEEGEILARYLDARDLKVRQIMTPRTDLIAVSAEATPGEVREVFRRTRRNILPVYEEDLDHIIGFVRARDFLRPQLAVRDVIQPIHAVPESKRIVDLLQEFKTEGRQLALVIDEYGGTDGLVTIKDIFEELVGPVAETWDPAQPIIRQFAAGKFLVSGSAFLDDIGDITGWSPPEAEASTLSGLLAERLGRIPDAGEEVDFNGVIVRVIRRTPRHVEGCLIKVTPLPAKAREDGP